MCRGCGFDPQSGHIQVEPTNEKISGTNGCLFPPSFLSLSLKKRKKAEKRISERGLYHIQTLWKYLKRMKAKRPLNVATNRPLVMGESGSVVVKEDSCQVVQR